MHFVSAVNVYGSGNMKNINLPILFLAAHAGEIRARKVSGAGFTVIFLYGNSIGGAPCSKFQLAISELTGLFYTDAVYPFSHTYVHMCTANSVKFQNAQDIKLIKSYYWLILKYEKNKSDFKRVLRPSLFLFLVFQVRKQSQTVHITKIKLENSL